ncbi:unnamed protein product [Vicia faba]|uniref:Uncharacterized protein n=1 Tax=Vicia faba TaxID=3906 RepID=A0AAV0ZX30_VICFA|nr:unnamed protein product [Vicia faba]
MPEHQHYVKSESLPCLGAADKHIRSMTGTIISVVVQTVGVSRWPELLLALVNCLNCNDLNHMEGAMDALSKSHLKNVIEYMLQVNKDIDEEVALESYEEGVCNLW